MPSFNGRKSGEGDQAAVLALMPYAQQQAYIHAQRLKATGVTSGRWHCPLPDGGRMVSIIHESGLAEILVYPVGVEKPIQVPAILDYYSGLVFGGNINKQQIPNFDVEAPPPVYKLYSFFPTTEAAAKFPVELPTPYTSTQPIKLAVEMHEDFNLIVPIKSTNAARSQYTHLRPSLFYGTMRKVVQFVMGIGKVIHPTWYETNIPFTPPEEATPGVPMFAADAVEEYQSTTKGVKVVQLTYDFRYNNSYGVYKEVDNRWWLVRIDQALGVIAMPLPLDYASTLPEFRTALEESDEAVAGELKVLDTFGGFPTGAGFEKQVESYVRAGAYVRLAAIEDMPDYVGLTWGSQTGWAFNYDGNVAKVVAYEDIDLGDYGGGYAAMCRAVRDMSIEITVRTAEPFYTGPAAQALAAALSVYIPTEGEDAKPWLLFKLGRLTEEQATPLLAQYNAATGDVGEAVTRILGTLETLVAAPIGTGLAELKVEGRWAFNPPATLFKAAELNFDMCPSVTWPAMTVLVEHGDFKSPGTGERVPLVRFFTENGDERVVWFHGGEKDTYMDRSVTPNVKVEYQSLAPCCYVEVQPAPSKAKNIQPGSYYEYKAYGLKHTWTQVWAGNDVTPEGYYRDIRGFQRLVEGKQDGGPDKADIQFGSAYCVFGDNEAALEFLYTHKQGIGPYNLTHQHYNFGDVWSYDFFWVNYTTPDAHGEVTCYLGTGAWYVYCHQPDPDTHYVGTEWVNPYEWNEGLFALTANLGPWARPGDRVQYLYGDIQPLPQDEAVAGTSSWSEMRTTVYANGTSQVTKVDNTYVPRNRAWFDILELQKSVYDPPPESPFIEHEVRGSSNCFGTPSATVMQGVNDYTYAVFGTLLQSGQEGDLACFVGVILD